MKNFKHALFVSVFLSLTNVVLAQQKITGTVTSQVDKGVLPGVSVLVKGTTMGTITNENGVYEITLPNQKATLVFSFIGYKTREVSPEPGQAELNISLSDDTENLDEVVVTALGVKKESKRLGYSAETVKLNEIQQNRTTNFMTSLQGKVAGLDITPPSSGAGSTPKYV